MNDNITTGYIRTKVICVFRNENRILVGDAYDPTKRQTFYCPPGGGVHFGEKIEDALRREMREELKTEILNPILLGVLENLFTFDGKQGHEIVFVYDAKLADKTLYDVSQFTAHESNGEPFNAIWLDVKSINSDTPPIYPDGLIQLLSRHDFAALRERKKTDDPRLEKQIRFLHEIDKLKTVLRSNKILDGSRLENSAEHSWSVGIMAHLLAEHSDQEIDVNHVCKMLLCHDIVEVDAGAWYGP